MSRVPSPPPKKRAYFKLVKFQPALTAPTPNENLWPPPILHEHPTQTQKQIAVFKHAVFYLSF